MFDLLIKNGLICDGTGGAPFTGDMAVSGGKIAAVAPKIDGEAAKTIDAAGLVVSPAFIDMHSHSDLWYLEDERCQSKLYQGIATEVVGQCGSSPFPRSVGQLAKIRDNAADDGEIRKSSEYQSGSFGKLLKKVEQNGDKMSVNLVQLVGHNAIRRGVVGLEGRASTEEENGLSAFLLDESLSQGAWGLSLGLGYMPGIFSDMKELEALGHVCARHGVVITSHMRDEGDGVFQSVDEMIEIYRRTGARVHIAHLKLASKNVWGQAAKLFEHIQRAQDAGVKITADMYPYNASSTGITNVLQSWAMEGGNDGALRRVSNPGEDFDRIYEWFLERYPDKKAGDGVYIVSTGGQFPVADDKTIGQLSEILGLSVPDTLIKVLVETKCRADGIFFSMDENDSLYLLARDVAIGSDGSARPFDPAKNDGKPHPRAFGTFPRFLRLRREKNLCPLETAIRRITQKPAQIVGIKDRGTLKEGMVADITVFDEKTIADTATFSNPFQKPLGIHHVIIGGKPALENGEQTENRLGGYLLRKV